MLNEFKNRNALLDIYFEQMNAEAWIKVFDWLSGCSAVSSINCYIPETDQNLEYLPKNIAECMKQEGFYCFISLTVSGINLVLRFYIESEIECDISPNDIGTEQQLHSLFSFLEQIRTISGVSNYVICPENSKEEVFIVNGNLVNQHT
ncbi:hypothetical protein CBP51_12535 [Cellvibrio mixtus]|uniref:Uncharacterized protein n=1 Tax=Cellvibrio mixtus TaxID=39650 RepID=A0A266QD30_9GAMM|nr:hypothetical protein [Cellvibrio mixtus]OZY87745.1 hypothetical protein CBP51_12535 [Cellvibrio mixtus]